MKWFAPTILCMLSISCTKPNPAYDPNPGFPDECSTGNEVVDTFTSFSRPEKLDILFVVDAVGDDSPALQELFANAIGPLGGVLRTFNIDARTAVATTDATVDGLSGPGTSGPGCSDNGALVADLADDDWAKVTRCNLFAAPAAKPYSQPLSVVTQILESPPEGFLRPGARLLVVVGTQSDDCSATAALSGSAASACASAELYRPAELVEGWSVIPDAPDTIALAVFAGPPSDAAADANRPVCSSTIGSAAAGNRLFDAADAAGELGWFNSVCSDDLFRPLAGVIEELNEEVPVRVCVPSPSAHAPLAVRVDGDAVPDGPEGVDYIGSTDSCSTGVVTLHPSVVRGADEIEITYCTE